MKEIDMEKFIQINNLTHEIQDTQKKIKLGNYIPDRLKNHQEIVSDKIVFAGIDLEDYEVIKYILDKQKGKDIANLGNIKIDMWSPAFPKNQIPKTKLKYDLVLSGSGLLLWPLGFLFGGRWLEEHLYFIDENFDDTYKNYDSWNNEKYIPKQMREKVSNLINLIGKAPFNILCSPYEVHKMNSCGQSQRNLIDLRLKLCNSFKYDKIGLKSSFREDVYHIYIAILTSEFGVAEMKQNMEVVNDKYNWTKEVETNLDQLCLVFSTTKRKIIPFMSELFCVKTRKELILDGKANTN